MFVRGFEVRTFGAAFIGSILISLVSWVLQTLLMPRKEHD
jgi:uncharacterized membrane protein YvlD (DUF360 family)